MYKNEICIDSLVLTLFSMNQFPKIEKESVMHQLSKTTRIQHHNFISSKAYVHARQHLMK